MSKLIFITLEKVLEMKENGEPFTLVDTLPENFFKDCHLPGAINIPSKDIAQEAEKKIDRNIPVVTYCAGYTCPVSTRAAKKLLEMGYSQVFDFKGGIEIWKEAGLPLET